MDFIAEMILGYGDLKLSQRINNLGISDFEIIRYRDDYRIFTNNPQTAQILVRNITEILIELGLRLNPHKTVISSNVIESSIKPDKLFWITAKRGNKSIQEHLLLIYKLSKEHQDSGSLVKALNKFFHRLSLIRRKNQKKLNVEELLDLILLNKSTETISLEKTFSDVKVLISIIVDIAYHNPRTYPISAAILSLLFSFMSDDEISKVSKLIVNKFNKIPNTGHLELWLQRAIYSHSPNKIFDEKLCRKIADESVKLWNSEWLNDEISSLIDGYMFIDKSELQNMDAVVSEKEIKVFSNSGY